MNRSARGRNRGWLWLLILPYLGLLFPGLYAHREPLLGGIPFFYWYQFGWVFLTSLITWIVHKATR